MNHLKKLATVQVDSRFEFSRIGMNSASLAFHLILIAFVPIRRENRFNLPVREA